MRARTPPIAMAIDDFIGRRIDEVLPADVAETGMRAVRETLEHGRSTGHQYTLEVQDNVNRFEISASRKPASDGGVPTCILMARDITERWRAQREREYQEELLRGLFQLSPVGIALKTISTPASSSTPTMRCSPRRATPADEFLQLNYWDVTPREYEQAEGKQLASMLETGRYGPFEKRVHPQNRAAVPGSAERHAGQWS